MPSHLWSPLKDFEELPQQLATSDLRSLLGVWQDRRVEIEKFDSFRLFVEKLNREWAVETGLIERLYSLDRGITQLLIDRGPSMRITFPLVRVQIHKESFK